MPRFKQIPADQQQSTRGAVPQELVDEYKQYVEQLEKGNVGLLEFNKTENIDQARKALEEAAEQLRKYVKIRRKRGENALQFQQITQREWQDKKRRSKERASKIRQARARR